MHWASDSCVGNNYIVEYNRQKCQDRIVTCIITTILFGHGVNFCFTHMQISKVPVVHDNMVKNILG